MDKPLWIFAIFSISSIIVVVLYLTIYIPITNQNYDNEIDDASCSELNLLLKENLSKYVSEPYDMYKRQAIIVANVLKKN